MIKLEITKQKGGTTVFLFETRNTSKEGLDELDEAYSALLGSRQKRGGYLDSNKFEIEVMDEDL